ncbi:MAG: hypothetical protein EKK68_06835 [Candidatus Competibacteraceae bacterium]|nr:MAG: hypothetical protein EKK68_06835 [Candidatus Competibacteraceae bacterium]
MRSRLFATVISNAALFGCGGLAVYLLVESEALTVRFAYAVLTMLLMVYLWLEVIRIRRNHPERWLLNPAVICALMTFVMGYGLTNVLFFMPPESLEFLGLVPDVSLVMVKHQYLALLGALTLFLGYWSPLAAGLSRPVLVTQFQRRFLPGTDTLRFWALPALVAVAVIVRLYAIRLGVYGYGSSVQRLEEAAAFTQYISIAGSLGKLALVLAALQYFKPGAKWRETGWLWGITCIEVVFGLMSGFKSAVAMPFFIIGVCQYLRTGKLPRNWIIFMMIAIFAAYAVIEPFRAERNRESGELSSVTAISNALMRGITNSKPVDDDSGSTTLSIASRMNLSYIGSFGIEYADALPELPEGSPAFLENILLAPAHAVVPRFLWESKPLGTLGLWYNQVVMGNTHFSSTAMGPFTYLYFAGGYWAVGIAFFLFGILQRALLSLCEPWRHLTGSIVFLSMLPTLAVIDSSVNGILVDIFRILPLLLLLLHILYRRRPVFQSNAMSYMPNETT